MSGVQAGTRLERLRVLRDRIDHEIAVEAHRAALDDTRGSGGWAEFQKPSDRRTASRLEQLGVTAKQVKQWAVRQGLVDGVHRGRCADRLIDAYALAHERRR